MSNEDSTSLSSEEKAERQRQQKRNSQREWRKKNKGKVRENECRQRTKHRALLAQRAREYRAKYPDRVKESWRRNREKHRATVSAAYARTKREVLQHYGGRCVCCGESAVCFLTIDHANNDGNLHRRKGDKTYQGSGYRIYQWLKRHGYPAGFQILCYNCNCAKQHDPIGHRQAHEKACEIDNLGDVPAGLVGPNQQKSESLCCNHQLLLFETTVGV